MTAFIPVSDFYREPTSDWTCNECDRDAWSCNCEPEAALPPLTDEQRAEAIARINAAFSRVVADKRRAA